MNAVAKIESAQPRSVLVAMADRYGMEPGAFEQTVRATVCPANVSREQFAAFLLVAKEHRLNPLTKEIYAFPAKGGGIQPIVGIDGWARIINEHPAFDGMAFIDERDSGELVAITCRMYRKDRTHPIEATEYMAECKRGTDVWKTWPRRMLRHKAMIQAARYAFGFSGIVDQDEYERQVEPVATPGLRARLEARNAPAQEGFSAHHGRADAVAEQADPDTGEIIDAEVEEAQDTQPEAEREQPAETKPQEITLTQAAMAYETRLREAPNTTKIRSIHEANAKLRGRLDDSDPERLAELDALFNDLYGALEQKEADERAAEASR
jgi:phage recombination protein Bet